ncbi:MULTISPECIES: hypothetical protein [Paenibacillus]|uniref:hypothetical protein n=1 Tax=Paenibacillus TaxID=44249 RepID=UPI00020D66BA|nr:MULTISPECIES: hypothetical protein [Paenibacillus]EGL17170.1 hypothetical protein HMPREF9413_5480 [Paenibacillus sp. HGF7]EPD80744.1 hypothetical protein HMPREF1207_04500 [Paenibacillus sp. HGH0039]MBV6714608.1 hypothetical protein [Paenibacillus chitinolyticus]
MEGNKTQGIEYEQPILAESDLVNDNEEESHYLPPRSSVHPSERAKVTRWFYRLLLFLFILLVMGLGWWGIRYTSGT